MRLALALAVVACSSSNKSGVDAQPDASIYTGPCTMTLTGLPLQQSTYACTTTTAWTSSTDQGRFEIDPINFPAGLQFSDVITWPGMPVEGDYHSGTAGVGGGVSLRDTAPMMPSGWSTGATNGSASGSYALSFARVGDAMPSTDGNTYTAHGDLEATLVGVCNCPTVTLSARF